MVAEISSKYLISEIFVDTNTKQSGEEMKQGEQGDCHGCCTIEKVLIYLP